MNLLVDANLSPSVATQLRDAGYDAMHVADVGLATAIDPEIVDCADDQGMGIVTVDTDFPILVALHRAASPSAVLLRGVNELAPEQHAALVIANLPTVADDLDRGAVVSLTRPPSSPEPATRLSKSSQCRGSRDAVHPR